MRWRVILTVAVAWALTAPLSLTEAQQSLQQKYLDIYLTINTAEHLEKQGDFRGALDDFKDCYAKLAKIHESDPNWETALVVHRLADCQAKIIDLQPKAEAQAADTPPPSAPEPTTQEGALPPVQPSAGASATPDDIDSLKLELAAVKEELRLTKEKYKDSESQLETYRLQLDSVNQELAAVKSQQSVDEGMGKLLSENKALTDKLATAQKEIDAFKSNPRSKLALAQAQLKNLQDQYAESQEANKALQTTTTTLKQQLDQAQADLVTANQKLVAAGTGSPEYLTLKRENEVMREIIMQELQEQAHRDMAKRLAQEEFDNLKLKSKVLQENLDILATPMVPATTDEQRAFLASLKVPAPDVTQVPSNGFSAPVGPAVTADPAAVNSSGAPAPSGADTNATSATPPATDSSTNPAPVNIVMNNPQAPAIVDPATPSATNTAGDPSINSTASSPTPDPAAPQTNVLDANAPIPPNTPSGQVPPAPSALNPSTPPSPNDPPAVTGETTSKIPGATTTYTDTTINHDGDAAKHDDPTRYSAVARLPDDMRDTAQDAADLFRNQKYDESAAKYQSIIDKYPESLYAWSNLGVVRFQQGKYDDALKALQQAVKLSPTDAFSYSNLGIVYYQLNQYENAIDALNSAKALDPDNAKTHNYLGCACSQKGWQEVAEKEFRKAIEIDPNFGDAHFNLALVYATSKPPSLELARREYNRALELGIARDARLEKLLHQTQQ